MTSIPFAPKLGIFSLRGALIAISDEGPPSIRPKPP